MSISATLSSESPFRSYAFSCLWLSRLTSGVGDVFTLVCLPLLLLHLSNSSFALASALAFNALPRIVFVLVGGAIADLTSPLRLIYLTGIAQAALAFMLASLALSDSIAVWMIYLTSFISGWFTALSGPAGPVLVSKVVPPGQLPAANSLIRGSAQVVESGAPLLVGAIIAFLVMRISTVRAYGVAFLIDGASFVLAFLLLFSVARARPELAMAGGGSRSASALLRSVRDGLMHATHHRTTLGLLTFAALSEFLTVGCLSAGLPLIANASDQPTQNLGILLSSMQVGAFLGTLFSSVLSRVPMGKWVALLIASTSLRGLCVMAIGAAMDTVSLVAAAAFAIGVARSFNLMLVLNLIQRTTPGELMGRVLAVFTSATAFMTPLAMFAFSGLEQRLGIGTTFVLLGGANAVVVAVLVAMRGAEQRA